MSASIFLRVFIWISCLVGFLYQTSSMLSLFFDYPFSVTLVEDVRRNLLFPAATVCLHRWSVSGICSFKRCAGFNTLLNPERWYFLRKEVTTRMKVAHGPDELFQCHMRSKVTECASFSCNSAYPNEMCYTIDNYQWTNSQHPMQQCESPWNYELLFRASWDRNVTVALEEPDALPLILHSPYSCPPDKLSSVMIQPGMTYSIAISQPEKDSSVASMTLSRFHGDHVTRPWLIRRQSQGSKEKVERLPAPYKSSCTDYISMGNQKKYFGYYTQDICVQNCEMTLEMKHCQCVRTHHEFAATFGGPGLRYHQRR
ncbi:hypothetical protein MRX96_028515 [Rhipicephalus microplus]